MNIKELMTTHAGKMEDIPSISTSPRENSHCDGRCNVAGTVCSHCYSFKLLNLRPSLAEKLKRNTTFLTTCELEKSDVSRVNSSVFRFESFGDLINTLQFKNYCTIAEANPQTTFSIWTKNPDIIKRTFEKYGIRKPKNMIIIYSSPILNHRVNRKYIKSKWPFVNKTFTVYTKPQADDVTINCRGKSCIDCMTCYTKNNQFYINELLK